MKCLSSKVNAIAAIALLLITIRKEHLINRQIILDLENQHSRS